VAVLLLRQHFVRAFWNDNPYHNNNDGDDSSAKNNESYPMETKYEECSRYLQQHRLTCAFEVVTAVLGDHGQIPQQDFLILTAIADRQHERFYTTLELVEFCHVFRLPHNDTFWTFTTLEAAQQLLY
jgi:hypothetical protein